MPDPAEQLQRLYLEGFGVETFERYPNSVGVVRDGMVALFTVTPQGLQMLGAPGLRMGEVLGVLVERGGRQLFQFKSEEVIATPEHLDALRRFREDVARLLAPTA
jgi:hypothetical protein